jgi:hypothetical protein
MIDESLTKDINEDKKKTNLLVNNFTHENAIIIKIKKKKHGNMFDSICKGLDFLSIYCEILMTVDSDTIFKDNWIYKNVQLLQKLEKNNTNKPIIVSGFNTVNTKKHIILKEYDDYYEKNSVGGCHLCFHKKNYLNIFRYTLHSYKWDTNIINLCKKNNGLIATTKPSVIDHIGYKSTGHRLNDSNDKNNIYDFAFDFT